MGKIGDPQAAGPLLPLIDEEYFGLANAGVWALDAMRAREALVPLKRRLRQLQAGAPKGWRDDEVGRLQISIARAIRHIEDGKPPDPRPTPRPR